MEVREAEATSKLLSGNSFAAAGRAQEKSVSGMSFSEHFPADSDKKLKFGSGDEILALGRNLNERSHGSKSKIAGRNERRQSKKKAEFYMGFSPPTIRLTVRTISGVEESTSGAKT